MKYQRKLESIKISFTWNIELNFLSKIGFKRLLMLFFKTKLEIFSFSKSFFYSISSTPQLIPLLCSGEHDHKSLIYLNNLMLSYDFYYFILMNIFLNS